MAPSDAKLSSTHRPQKVPTSTDEAAAVVQPSTPEDAEFSKRSTQREWEQTWRQLSTDARALEAACAEEHTQLSQIAEFRNYEDESPIGSPIGLWGWMDECLWGSLANLRAQVKEKNNNKVKAHKNHEKDKEDNKHNKNKKDKKGKKDKKEKKHKKVKKDKRDPSASSSSSSDDELHDRKDKKGGGTEPSIFELKPELEEFRAQHANLAAVLDVAVNELESIVYQFSSRCSGWVMEPSILGSPAIRTPPPWRGVRGGDGGWTEAQIRGRGTTSSSASGQRVTNQVDSVEGDMMKDAISREVREALAVLDDQILQAGGLTGGWSQLDHDIFHRFFRMYRKQPSHLLHERLSDKLPEKCMDEIAAHVEWFIEFDQLQSSKRQLFASWRERISKFEQDTAEEQEMIEDRERRRKEGLKRSRIEEQRRLVSEWSQAQKQLREDAKASHRQMCAEEARKKKERARKQQQAITEQQKSLDKFRQQRAVQQEAEKQTSSAKSVPVSPEVRRAIRRRNSELLRKLGEDAQTLRRQQSEPVMKSWKNPAYQHVESNLYASTAVFSHRVAARFAEPMEYESPSPKKSPSLREWRVYHAWLSSGSPPEDDELRASFANQPLYTIPEPPSLFEAVD